jgi:putative transposase
VIQARQENLPKSDQFWLTKAQLKRIEPFSPRTRGIPRVDDRRVVSGIAHVIQNGLRWRDAPAVYGPHKTLYNRFVRWSRMGIFDRIFANLAAESGPPNRMMIDSTHLKAHRTAASLLKTASHRPHERRAKLQAERGFFLFLWRNSAASMDCAKMPLGAEAIKDRGLRGEKLIAVELSS